MRVLFLPKTGVDLFHALHSSETSREALRFYQPVQTPAGVEISMASLGSALSLASDLRWYVRRYMSEVLFEISKGVFCTRALAQEIYFGRAAVLHTQWKYRRQYVLKGGRMVSDEILSAEDSGASGEVDSGSDVVRLVIWCTEGEFLGRKEEESDE